MEQVPIVLGCIPVDCDRNRALAVSLGIGHIPFPLPYKESVQDSCKICGGPMWVGPEIKAKRLKMIQAGEDPLVVCLLCASVYASAGGVAGILSLSDKRSERGD